MTIRMIIILSSVAVLACCGRTAWADAIPADVPPRLEQGRVMMPLRAVGEWLCGDVRYGEVIGLISLQHGDKRIILHIGASYALVNGAQVALDVPPLLRDGRAYVPLRFVAEALGAQVHWDAVDRLVTIRHEGREGSLHVPWHPDAMSLHDAAASGYTQLVRRLLGDGARLDAANEDGFTPLHLAVGAGHVGTARLLLERGADPAAPGMFAQTPLHSAAAGGDVATVALLLDRGAQLDVSDETGWTPLHLASRQGNLETARLLLDRGAPVNAADNAGQMPLHVAAFAGQSEIARLLLERGADLSAKDGEWDETPLDKAVRHGHSETARLLREAGGTR